MTILVLLFLVGSLPTVVWLLVVGARRQAVRTARELGLEPAALGYEGSRDGVRLRLMPNATLDYPDVPGTAPAIAASSTTGETLIVATLPRAIEFPLFLESTAVRGRRLRAERIESGFSEIDAVLSLLTPNEARATRLLTAEVRAALRALYDKRCCLFEIDSFDVAVHTGHHGRAVELAGDAVALARLLSRSAAEAHQ